MGLVFLGKRLVALRSLAACERGFSALRMSLVALRLLQPLEWNPTPYAGRSQSMP